MATGHDNQQAGRQMFLAQRARLRSSLAAVRTNNTASRFNRLDEAQRKVIFILANDAALRSMDMPQLGRSHLNMTYEDFNFEEQRSLMLGIKRLTDLAAAVPWEFAEYAAPRNEIQAIRDTQAESEAESTIN